MFVHKERHERIEQHAECRTGDVLRCQETGEKIQMIVTGRSLWIRPFRGGSGEVVKVIHPYCPACEPKPEVSYGDPIYGDELLEVVPIFHVSNGAETV